MKDVSGGEGEFLHLGLFVSLSFSGSWPLFMSPGG